MYKIYTGAGGADLINQAFEKKLGFERVYQPKKVPRYLQRMRSKFKTDYKGRKYRLIGSFKMPE